jgi:hypothetical protein
MLRTEFGKLAIKRPINPIPRIGLRGHARLARHNHDQTIAANLYTNDLEPRRLNGFGGPDQVGFFEGRGASHETSNCTNFATLH